MSAGEAKTRSPYRGDGAGSGPTPGSPGVRLAAVALLAIFSVALVNSVIYAIAEFTSTDGKPPRFDALELLNTVVMYGAPLALFAAAAGLARSAPAVRRRAPSLVPATWALAGLFALSATLRAVGIVHSSRLRALIEAKQPYEAIAEALKTLRAFDLARFGAGYLAIACGLAFAAALAAKSAVGAPKVTKPLSLGGWAGFSVALVLGLYTRVVQNAHMGFHAAEWLVVDATWLALGGGLLAASRTLDEAGAAHAGASDPARDADAYRAAADALDQYRTAVVLRVVLLVGSFAALAFGAATRSLDLVRIAVVAAPAIALLISAAMVVGLARFSRVPDERTRALATAAAALLATSSLVDLAIFSAAIDLASSDAGRALSVRDSMGALETASQLASLATLGVVMAALHAAASAVGARVLAGRVKGMGVFLVVVAVAAVALRAGLAHAAKNPSATLGLLVFAPVVLVIALVLLSRFVALVRDVAEALREPRRAEPEVEAPEAS